MVTIYGMAVGWNPAGSMLASASFDATVAIWERKDGGMHVFADMVYFSYSRDINYLNFSFLTMWWHAIIIISQIGQKIRIISHV